MANLRPKVLNANGYDELLDDGDTIQLVAAPTADDHATNRLYVDTTVTTAVDAEEAARIAADAVLQGNIDAEASTRADEDSNLQDQIDAITGGTTPGANPYVLRTGDDMSGNLTLGTDKITLNATSGDINSASNVIVGGNPLSGSATGVRLRFGGDIQVSGASAGDALLQGYTTGNSSATVDIKANGTATFAGALEAASIDGGTY